MCSVCVCVCVQELVSTYVGVLRRLSVCVGACVLLLVCVRYRDPVQQSLQVLQQLRETHSSLQEALQRAGAPPGEPRPGAGSWGGAYWSFWCFLSERLTEEKKNTTELKVRSAGDCSPGNTWVTQSSREEDQASSMMSSLATGSAHLETSGQLTVERRS